MIRGKVDMVSYFMLGASTASGFSLLQRYEPSPTYFVYQLYKQFGTELVQASSADDDVTIYAAKRDDGTLTLMVVNLGPDEASKTLQIDGFEPAGDAEVWRFDAEHNSVQIDPQAISSGGSITVPGQSITLYIMEGAA
jgi:hypothetical protein